MSGDGPRPWNWPRIEGIEEPATGFKPAEPGREPERTADEQAERLIRESARRAKHLVQNAHDEAEKIRRTCHSEALAQAGAVVDAALEEVVGEMTAAFAGAQQLLLRKLEDAATERLDELERDLTRVVAMMAEKVIHRKVEAEDGVVLDVVRATIERATGANRLTVRIPPPSELLVREAMAELLAIADGAEQLEVVADQEIGPGGCIVETERGRFDARIATQMDRLSEEMRSVTGGAKAK
jgi:flagellar biosynthesis/type III secretory pathway protein FliH